METEFLSAASRNPALNRSREFRVSRIPNLVICGTADAFCPLVPSNIGANPSDVAAWPCEARHNAKVDGSGEDPDDRAGGFLKIEHKVVGDSDNQIWVPTNYLASEVRIMRCTPFTGISLDQEIPPRTLVLTVIDR
jgi:hypothetical protein